MRGPLLVLSVVILSVLAEPPVPQGQYGAPSSQYGAPSSQYGAPSSQYGAPSSQYGAPSSQYGAPSLGPSSQYGAPSKGTSSQFGTPGQYSSGGFGSQGYGSGQGGPQPMFTHEQDFRRTPGVIWGQWSVVLPDGRTQRVEYDADERGFHPTITFEDPGDNRLGAGSGAGGY